MSVASLTRRLRKAGRRCREARMLVSAFQSPYLPVVAHLIPIRRCNLACAYCSEYDDYSAPVPTRDLIQRVDLLADLGTAIVTMSGGEPLLHPALDEIIGHVRRRGMIATVITNGYLLTRDRIDRLNRAGLDHLQISIDNVTPDEVSKKSLKVLDRKLQALADCATFDVTVNAVVGGGVRSPDDAVVVAERARSLGFSTTVGIIHDGRGRLMPLDERQRSILEAVVTIGRSAFDFANYNRFQRNLADGQPNQWHCPAGSRYLYVCEDGLVHWCSQQRGRPGVPLERYGLEDLEREYHRVKSCAPFCTVGCVHRVAQVDELRQNPEATVMQWFSPAVAGAQPNVPTAISVLMWAFVTGKHRDLFRRTVLRVFAVNARGRMAANLDRRHEVHQP